MTNKAVRQVPNDINAEAAVLSAMMISSDAVAEAMEVLETHSFYRKIHQIIFDCIVILYNDDIEADIITLIDKLKEKKQLEIVGGEAFINELSDVVLSESNVVYHANIVRDHSYLREMIATCQSVMENCYTSDKSTSDIMLESESKILKITMKTENEGLIHVRESTIQVLKDMSERAMTKRSYIGIPSGFYDIDRKIDLFKPGEFVVLAARPSMGKTTLAMNMVSEIASRYGKRIAVFSFEMVTSLLVIKLLSADSGISQDSIMKGVGIGETEMIKVATSAEALGDTEIYVNDKGGRTVLDMKRKLRKLVAAVGEVDLIVLDYMQQMRDPRHKNSVEALTEISGDLKQLAKNTLIPILALNQLNRDVEKREDKRPKLSDLKGSGGIEQDADVVLFIYRDEVYNEDSEMQGLAEIIIAKNRMGALGKAELVFRKETSKFASIHKEN